MSQEFDFGTYGDPHRMFVQAVISRGIITGREFSNLIELVMQRCEGDINTMKLSFFPLKNAIPF